MFLQLVSLSILSVLIATSAATGMVGQADTCTRGPYSDDCPDATPYLCNAKYAPRSDSVCSSGGLCCCESRDGLFASTCANDDVCCNGSCCDENKSFCCGGACCNLEAEVCCEDACVGKASFGTGVLVPAIMNGALLILGYCTVVKAHKDVRVSRFGFFMMLMTLFGVVQVVLARSSWDCSTNMTVVFWVGAVEAGVGFLMVLLCVIKAAVRGEGVLAAFTLERLVIAVVDAQGKVLGVAVTDQQRLAVTRSQLNQNQ